MKQLNGIFCCLAMLAGASILSPSSVPGADTSAVSLPDGVKAVWEIPGAYCERTPTRERICLNGLWRWQPASEIHESVPTTDWGYFKVPGPWPGITDYMQKDCQTVHVHPAWKAVKLGAVTAAWYQREIAIPDHFRDRRLVLQLECLNSFATVYLDGRKAGELRFPGGEMEITGSCRPGSKHLLSIHVVAMPLKGVLLSYSDSASAREVKGAVARRGLCGDVFLAATPRSARIDGVRVTTSVQQGNISFDAALEGLAADGRYSLHAVVNRGSAPVAQFRSRSFSGADLRGGRIAFTNDWKPDKLWDLHTPGNTFELQLSLVDPAGTVLDRAWNERFGFRELQIVGRDFLLNGSRISLSCVPLDNAQVGAAWATYAAAKESLERLRSFGINFVYTHNYGCEPGSHLGFEEILRAADDVGMLVALSQPHFSHYDWKAPGADQENGYARHAEAYVRVAGNHPSVVFYSMSHNATGYNEDMNPYMIDGKQDKRDQWAMNNVKLARRAEAIVARLDPSRIVYHHASGNLGPLHAINFYPNFVPIQELSDWFEHWATEGVKPVFLCEYGAPFTWDWTMYRGWYQGKREFGSARVPWEFCVAEWNAQFSGDIAYRISAAEKANLRWEAKQFRAGNLWHRWDYPVEVGSTRLEERYPVFYAYLTDNWRSFRTWGVSALSPWEHGHFWKLRDGVDRGRKNLPVDWENLQRPGFSPDYLDQRYERMDLAFERTDWVATPAAEALLRNNLPLLAWLAGKPEAFTSKDHIFLPGESFQKQLIILNNSRESVEFRAEWSLDLSPPVTGHRDAAVAPGARTNILLSFTLPPGLRPGTYHLRANVRFGNGEIQNDAFDILVGSPPQMQEASGRIALFDPQGETARWLEGVGVRFQQIDPGADLAGYDLLIVGKSALSVGGPAPDISRVRAGLKVLMFEQDSTTLEKRFGFRVAEYGLRQVFPRVADHPALDGLATEHLRDWRGAATILPPRLEYELDRRFNGAPTIEWCGLPVTRLWRCGNRGNVASVLIEKPTRGDFLPILDGGFSLQYSPLLEYREGRGMILFCQMDVTGRTERDPAAENLARNILHYAAGWKRGPAREAVYVGGDSSRKHLAAAGFTMGSFEAGNLSSNRVLVIGPNAEQKPGEPGGAIAQWIEAGGRVLALGLEEKEASAWLPFKISFKKDEHIAAFFGVPAWNSMLAGVSPAEVHNRDPRDLPLVTGGAEIAGDGVLAVAQGGKVVFCQMPPWLFEPSQPGSLRRTHRRSSFLVSRLLGNLGVQGSTPMLERFSSPVNADKAEQRWQEGLYLDRPEEWDDPYRFFRW
jgi:hypothetical protein